MSERNGKKSAWDSTKGGGGYRIKGSCNGDDCFELKKKGRHVEYFSTGHCSVCTASHSGGRVYVHACLYVHPVMRVQAQPSHLSARRPAALFRLNTEHIIRRARTTMQVFLPRLKTKEAILLLLFPIHKTPTVCRRSLEKSGGSQPSTFLPPSTLTCLVLS